MRIEEFGSLPFGVNPRDIVATAVDGQLDRGIWYRQKIQDADPNDPASVPTVNHVEIYQFQGSYFTSTDYIFNQAVTKAQIEIIGGLSRGVRTLDHGTFETLLAEIWDTDTTFSSMDFGADEIQIGGSSETGVIPVDNVPEINDVVLFDGTRTRYPLVDLLSSDGTGASFVFSTVKAGG